MSNKRARPLATDTVVLRYLSRREATHADIAAALASWLKLEISHHPSTRAVLARLHLRGEVEQRIGSKDWRITAKGKAALTRNDAKAPTGKARRGGRNKSNK